jgi:hypothetical protein
MDELVAKARRRIKRFIKTGEKQARVLQISDNVFEYRVVHHVHSLFFKRDKIGRLRQVTYIE